MLGESRSEPSFTGFNRKEGAVEVTGFREAQPETTALIRMSGIVKTIMRAGRRGFAISVSIRWQASMKIAGKMPVLPVLSRSGHYDEYVTLFAR
jgi:hypothetical protein